MMSPRQPHAPPRIRAPAPPCSARTPMSANMLALIDELAAIAVADYLRETAANDAACTDTRSDHPIADPRAAA